ncbi:hypothetical protein HUU39_17860 [candidate division KSB1 bacterium]|nr:hypothetical protein [candidate division KSB1 bacterium]
MTNTPTAEQIDQLAIQLPLQEQAKVLARLAQRLSDDLSLAREGEKHERDAYARRVEVFLKMSDEFAAESLAAVDSADDIRQLRDERLLRL